jgi:teichuronic acid biosynthesis glycosyltransferase TuaC
MHVTFVSYDDTPALGGQGRMLEDLRAGLRASGVTVSTVAGRGEHGIRYPRRIGRPSLDFSLYLGRHPELLTRENPDLVHVFGGPGGVLFNRPVAVPLIYHAHHTYRQAYGRLSPKRVMGFAEARAYRRATRVLAVSQSTADAVAAMGVARERIDIVPTSVDRPPDADTPHEANRILFVGRLEREKGVLDVFPVVAALARTHPQLEARIVGFGRLADEVRRRASAAGNVQVLGRVDEATLHAEYAQASLLLMPSRYEGLGRAALEAQAAGTPVVGYDVTGLRDAVREGGLLVPPGDIDGLGAACTRLLDDAALRRAMGRRGLEFVRQGYSPAVVVGTLTRIYAKVVGTRQS